MKNHGLTLAVALSLGATWAAGDDETAARTQPSAIGTVAHPLDIAAIRERLGVNSATTSGPAGARGRITVAVLDSGFDGWNSPGAGLPADATLIDRYDDDLIRRAGGGDSAFHKPLNAGDFHGRQMAQLLCAVAGDKEAAPKLLLLNANGPTMFRRAVRAAIEAKASVILFSADFGGAGNYDGRGPINQIVNEAIAAGIVWINASGNYGGSIYNGPVRVSPDGEVLLGPAPRYPGLTFRNRLDENTVTVTLTWNDYKPEEDAGTDKDLDLYIVDAAGNRVGASELEQVLGPTDRPNTSRNPRERVVLPNLASGVYRIQVRAKSLRFGEADRLRILVASARTGTMPDAKTGRPIPVLDFLDANAGGEVYPPADHPGVIAVGDGSASSSVGPTSDGRAKPDVLISNSEVRWSNGEATSGTSNAAALFAGVAAKMLADDDALTADRFREVVRIRSARSKPMGPLGKEIATDSLRGTSSWPYVIYLRGVTGQEVRAFRDNGWGLTLTIPIPPADLPQIFRQFPRDRARRLADRFAFLLATEKRLGGLFVADGIGPADQPPPAGSVRVQLDPGRSDPALSPVRPWEKSVSIVDEATSPALATSAPPPPTPAASVPASTTGTRITLPSSRVPPPPPPMPVDRASRPTPPRSGSP